MDPNYFVRYQASNSLLIIHDHLLDDISDYDEIYTYISYDEDYIKRAGEKINPKLKGKDIDMVHSQAVNMLKDLLKDKRLNKKS